MTEERRLVTVLFADVTGSTALGESFDPEDVRILLARFYAIAKEVVAEHGGTLEKFIGDAVMAVFGLPQAHGDDAQRALSAALELRERVRADPKLGERLPIRLGVNTGEVVAVRDVSAGDFLMTGDAVNVAARLQQAVEPWSILCGERTAHAAGSAFIFGPALNISAKGKGMTVTAVTLLGRTAAPVARKTPFVGRDRDLAHLELVARRTFEERHPFLVSLVAPAGTGKTRLLEEFLNHLPVLAPTATVAIAQCLPYGQRLTYWPLRAVLFRLAGVRDDVQPEALHMALRSWLHDSRLEATERVADFLAATVGLGAVEVIDRDALFTAWRTAVEVAAQRAPLVLIFEDLHWSSDSLLDLVEFVMHPRGDVPLLMLALARPELLDRRPAWGGGRRNYVSLSLEPLSDNAVTELVGHLLSAASQEIVRRIVERAEGNPFYVEEIVRSVMERVAMLGDTAAMERALATLPDTVQATVLARLDLLPPGERRVLQFGAVFGRAFRAAGVGAIVPEMAGEVGRLIDLLVAKDLIRPSGAGEFTFRHILIREVAYQTLPRAERARLHAAAGRWLEGTAAGREDALAELIAYHYREAAARAGAAQAGDAPSNEVRRRAGHWLRRAADLAAASTAFAEAGGHLQAAIDLAEPEDLPELYERLGDVSMGDAGARAYRKALLLCREAGRPADQELRVLASLLTGYTRWQGTIAARPSAEEIERLLADGRTLLTRVRDDRVIAMFLIAAAFFPFWKGADATSSDLAEAEANARRGLQISEGLDDPNLHSAALDALTSCAQERGAWDDAREFARQRLSFQERLNFIERLDAYSVVAWASTMLGDLAEADRVSASGLAFLQPGQAPRWALHVAGWRTYALAVLGRWDEAIESGHHARALWIEGGRGPTGYAVQGFIAMLDIARARRDIQLGDQSREVLETILASFGATSLVGRLRPYLLPEMEALVDKIVREFRAIPVSRLDHVERGLALCADRGWPLMAETVLPIAEFAASHQMRLLEAQALRALGVVQKDPAVLTHALNIFERIGAVPYAARARCELALLTKDESELTAGMRTLEALGDLDQLGRVALMRNE